MAIRLSGVSKVYRLYGSQRDQLIDVLRLGRIGIRPSSVPREFAALSDIDLDVPRGRRIGIVGRNGAGKTTLLKLVCGNFAPTSGTVEVDGTVQALLTAGIGFHPEYTGRENIDGAMQYNGLARDERQEAVRGIIDFCELGEFLDQPFKTYSLGMQARLMFAVATAVRPDILIVDEVLGAGDAYFVAKSKRRVQALVGSGCTMLLVSHSMPQVLEMCEEAIWIDAGRIRKRGPSFEVVKAYEEHMHGSIDRLGPAAVSGGSAASEIPSVPAGRDGAGPSGRYRKTSGLLQDPPFVPHGVEHGLPLASTAAAFNLVAPGGLSRWVGSGRVRICGFDIVDARGSTGELLVLEPAAFVIHLECPGGGQFRCRYAVNLTDPGGDTVASFRSPCDAFELPPGGRRRVTCALNPVQLGPGEYVVGIVVMDFGPLETINDSVRHDLLSRSFRFRVALPSSRATIAARFIHTSEWGFGEGSP
jgi:lipopolysaccharide transport system ATP-binding protein